MVEGKRLFCFYLLDLFFELHKGAFVGFVILRIELYDSGDTRAAHTRGIYGGWIHAAFTTERADMARFGFD